jgi:hypothetical protein
MTKSELTDKQKQRRAAQREALAAAWNKPSEEQKQRRAEAKKARKARMKAIKAAMKAKAKPRTGLEFAPIQSSTGAVFGGLETADQI